MVIARDQNAVRRQNIKADYSSFERVEQFKYLRTNLTNQNSVQEEIKNRLSQRMFAIIRCIISCLPVCYPKIQRSRYIEL